MTHRNRTSDEDVLTAYFQQIKRNRLLSFEDELDLSKRIQAGDDTARTRLVESNLRLVVKIAKSFVTTEFGLMDLIQEGNIGLLKAASKYDHRKGVRFSTYASWWIRQAITRALSNKRRSIRLPHRKEDCLRKIQRAFLTLNQGGGARPTPADVADELGMTVDEVNDLLPFAGPVASLDASINDDSGTLHDVCEDTSYAPDRDLLRDSMRAQTVEVLNRLRERERQVLTYRFALHGGDKYTLKQISEELGVSPETVRQIEMRALRKLRDQAGEIRELVYS